jgi:hypothetical protein
MGSHDHVHYRVIPRLGHALDTRGRKTMENAGNPTDSKCAPEQAIRAQQQALTNDETPSKRTLNP